VEINFFNFYNSMVFFCLLYPDEIDTCHELQMAYRDLTALYTKTPSSTPMGNPRKKQKKET
jgi:hypothetical protein